MADSKVALVTGASRGAGAGVARGLGELGYTVYVTGRSVESSAAKGWDGSPLPGTIGETAALITERGGKGIAVACDHADDAQVAKVFEQIANEQGRLDILVNNASLLSSGVLMEHKTDEMLKRTLEIGVWGNWWAMQAAFPHFKARGGGSVINFSSIDAQTGAWLHSDYNINKLGIVGMTRSAAVEWGRFNIRVNAIAPTGLGQVFAQLVKDVPGFLDTVVASNPLKRAGDPEIDIGPVVVFLASDMSRFVTGEMINVDGGQNLPGYVSIPHNLEELEKGAT